MYLNCNASITLQSLSHHTMVALVDIDICIRGLFCTKFNSKRLLFEAFFDVMRIFGSIEPQSDSFPFCILKDFKHIDLLSPLAPLVGQIIIYACGLFCMKFNSEQLLFEAIFYITHIFGSVQPESEPSH